MLARYVTDKYPHIEYALGALRGDSFFVCPAFQLAILISRFAPVSMYEFADMTVPELEVARQCAARASRLSRRRRSYVGTLLFVGLCGNRWLTQLSVADDMSGLGSARPVR
ncbi:MAG TPA: hypothetical protein VGG79_24345 [Roseiarcus sp.]